MTCNPRALAAFTLLLWWSSFLRAVTPGWLRAYGAESYDTATAVTMAADGGILVVGYSDAGQPSASDYSVTKLNPYGVASWRRVYGGQDKEYASAVSPLADGGFLIAGDEGSFNRATGRNVWVMRITATGEVSWQRTYGGNGRDDARAIAQTADGGSIVAGSTQSFGAGEEDGFLLRLSPPGSVIWQKSYGGTGSDALRAVRVTADGGLIVAGSTNSGGAGGQDFWVLRLDSHGKVLWQGTYGGTGEDIANAIIETKDGSFVVAGSTQSYGDGYRDAWIVRLDSSGDVLWQKVYGGSGMDSAESVLETPEGMLVVAGQHSAVGVTNSDAWVFQLTAAGAMRWQKAYGGQRNDAALAIATIPQRGYVVAGYTDSFGAGDADALVIRIGLSGGIGGACSVAFRATHEAPIATTAARGSATTGVYITRAKVGTTTVTGASRDPLTSPVCGPVRPDLMGSFGPFDYDPQTGETKVTFECLNIGTGGAGSFQMSMYYSNTPTLGSDSVLIGSDSVSGLAAGASYTMHRKYPQSDYVWTIVVIDPTNAIGEFDETNNQTAALLPR